MSFRVLASSFRWMRAARVTEALVALMAEMEFGTGDGRNRELDRAYGLAKIVSDHVVLCSKLAEPFDGAGKWECKR